MVSQDPEFHSQADPVSSTAETADRPTAGFLSPDVIEKLAPPETAWLEATFLRKSLPWLDFLQRNLNLPATVRPEAVAMLTGIGTERREWLEQLAQDFPSEPESARERRIVVRYLNHLASWDQIYPDLDAYSRRHKRRQGGPGLLAVLLTAEKRRLAFLTTVQEQPAGQGLELHLAESRRQLEQLEQLQKQWSER